MATAVLTDVKSSIFPLHYGGSAVMITSNLAALSLTLHWPFVSMVTNYLYIAFIQSSWKSNLVSYTIFRLTSLSNIFLEINFVYIAVHHVTSIATVMFIYFLQDLVLCQQETPFEDSK